MKTVVKLAAASAAVVVGASFVAPTTSQASPVFLGSAELNYAGNPQYCSSACLSSGQSAGTVTVTVGTGALAGDLLFDVDLNSGFTFMYQTQHNASFAFGLDVTGATVTVQKTDTGNTAGATATPHTNQALGDGVGTTWGYTLDYDNSKVSSDLEFVVSKSGKTFSLSDLVMTNDKHGNALWFVADLSNANGNTGFVGANTTNLPGGPNPRTTPLPAALPLFASGLGGFGWFGWRRRRKSTAAA